MLSIWKSINGNNKICNLPFWKEENTQLKVKTPWLYICKNGLLFTASTTNLMTEDKI